MAVFDTTQGVDPGTVSDREHDIQENPNPVIEDGFDTNLNEWQKVDSTYVDSTTSITNKTLKVTTTGAYTDSAWMNRNSYGKNMMIAADIVDTTNSCQFHMRETDNENLLLPYISGTGAFRISKVIATSFSTVETEDITDYSTTAGYKMVAKTFNNHVLAVLLNSSNEIINVLDNSDDSDIEALAGTANGLGSSGATAIYDNYKSQSLESYTNIVCLGDSNTGGSSNASYNPGTNALYPGQVLNKFLYDGIACINAGVSGDKSDDIYSRLSTDLYARFVKGARNVCTLMVGVNDIVGGRTGQQTWDGAADRLEGCVEQILLNGWELWLMTVPPYSGNTSYNTEIKALNNIIRENAQVNGYRVLDLWSLLVDESSDNIAKSEVIYADNIHYNAAGHRLISNLLIDNIDKPRLDLNTNNSKKMSGETKALTVTGTNWTTTAAYGRYSIDTDGSIWFDFSIVGVISPTTTSIALTIANVKSKSIANFTQGGGTAVSAGTSAKWFVTPDSSTFNVYSSSANGTLRMTGRYMLEEIPNI